MDVFELSETSLVDFALLNARLLFDVLFEAGCAAAIFKLSLGYTSSLHLLLIYS